MRGWGALPGWSALRLRLWWERAFWVLPALGVLAGLGVEIAVNALDRTVPPEELAGVTSGAASQVLAAIGAGMVTFTGLVFSFVVLVLQFGSSQYSPRTVAYFLRARSTQVILATFLFTITFTFLSLLNVGRESAPELAVLVAVLLLLVSLVAFIALLHSVGRRIRVDAVLSALGRQASSHIERRLAHATHRGTAPDAGGGQRALVMAVRHTGRTGQVVAVDGARLLRLARRHRLTLDVQVRLGDGVSRGTVLLACSPMPDAGQTSPLDAGPSGTVLRRLARCVVVDVERSLPLDPLYSLRLLVDIALRALSPGTNDPTTAVRALDEIEQVLRTAAVLPLGTRTLVDGPGRVTLSAPDWDDVLELALLEVLAAGAGQVQVTRRLSALLADLSADVPADRVPVLTAFGDRLLAAAEGRGEIALVPDRQGVGAARRPVTRRAAVDPPAGGPTAGSTTRPAAKPTTQPTTRPAAKPSADPAPDDPAPDGLRP